MSAILNELKKYFSTTVIRRGKNYLTNELVVFKKIAPEFIHATVSGTKDYEVILMFYDDKSFDFKCTCTESKNKNTFCKHVWGVLLQADSEQLLLKEVRGINHIDIAEVINIIEDKTVTKINRSKWRRFLSSVDLTKQDVIPILKWDSNKELIYIFNINKLNYQNSIPLEIASNDVFEDGTKSAPKSEKIGLDLISSLPNSLDINIISSLFINQFKNTNYYAWNFKPSQNLDSHHTLHQDTSSQLLPLITRTSRCFYRGGSHDTLIPLIADTSGSFDLKLYITKPEKEFEGDEQDEHYILTGVLKNESKQVVIHNGIKTLIGGFVIDKHYLLELKSESHNAWIYMLLNNNNFEIQKGELTNFLEEVYQFSEPPDVVLPEGIDLSFVVGKPLPMLSISKKQGANQATAKLYFKYGVIDVAPTEKRNNFFNKDNFEIETRNFKEEELYIERLIGLDFQSLRKTEIENEYRVSASKIHNAIRTLLIEGWRVEAEGKRYRQAGNMKLGISSGMNWFDLTGELNFEDSVVSLPEVMMAIRKGEQVVILKDGSIGLISDEMRNKFKSVSKLGDLQEDGIFRFKPNQALILDALLEKEPNISFDTKFDEARKQLSSFKGLKTLETPVGFVGELRDYQKEALSWAKFLNDFSLGGCLADDMGLGKTVVVLAIIQYMKNQNNSVKPSLVVVPKSLVFNWEEECKKFTPTLKLLNYTGVQRDSLKESIANSDIVITTYGTIRSEGEFFKDLDFRYIILDEAQAIKNSVTASFKATRLLKGDHRLALSGTPVENHLGELLSIFEFLNPGMLGIATSSMIFESIDLRQPDQEYLEFLSKILKPCILRRTKSEVAKDLPEKIEQTIFCELDPAQRRIYNELRDYYKSSLNDTIGTITLQKSKIHILEALLRLRQVACHPALINKTKRDVSSAKLDTLISMISEAISEGHKALVFSQFTSFLAIVKEELDDRNIKYEYLDGKTKNRQEVVDKYQNDDDCKLFLISLKAGGVGLNLTAAEYVFLLDPWWNPAVEAQAIDRTHRIGQTKNVFAYRLIAKDTVEEKVLQLQESKRNLADSIIKADSRLISAISSEDLELLFS